MVRKYVRKTNRKTWSEDSMRTALEAVIKEGWSIKRSSTVHQVPHATLSRKVHLCRLDPEKQEQLIANPKTVYLPTVFNKEQEMVLCQYIHFLDDQLIPLTALDVRRLAFHVADKYDLPHRFNKEIELAGEDWYRGFLKRNPDVQIKKPAEYTSEKVKLFTREKIDKFFDLLENVIEKYEIKPSNIYNLDETVLTCAGIDQANNSGSDQNKLVTVVFCFSASGVYMPLMLIFSQEERDETFLEGAPPDAWAEFNSCGQMQLDIFFTWFKKFISFSRASKDNPVLLIADGYRSYMKYLLILEEAEENGVHIICLPPYCTDKLQPLQHSYMKILGKAYSAEVQKWSEENQNRCVVMNKVYGLVGEAFMKISSIGIPVASFRNTGIWPTNRSIFDKDFNNTKDASETEDSGQSTSELFNSAVEEACHDLIINEPDLNQGGNQAVPMEISNEILDEPIVVISQQPNQINYIQPTNTAINQNHQTQQPIEQQQQYNQQPAIIANQYYQQNDNISCPVVIPPEAQLTEVSIEDLEQLTQSSENLHFYVSPVKLKLST